MHLGLGWVELSGIVHLMFGFAVAATMLVIAIPDLLEKRRSTDT